MGEDISTITPLYMNIDSENQMDAYYVKIAYEFDGINSGISFGNNSYAYGTAIMSPMTQVSADVYRFESVSNTTVRTGQSFDVLQYLKDFTYTSSTEFSTTTPYDFRIIITLDSNLNFESSHRTQTTIEGTLGITIDLQPNVVLSDNVNQLVITNSYLNTNLESSVASADATVDITGENSYLQFVLNTTTPLYAEGTVQGTATVSNIGWNYVIATSASGTSMTITSQNIVDMSVNNTIDLDALLTNSPVGTYSSSVSSIVAIMVMNYSKNGSDFLPISNLQANITYNISWRLCCVTGDTEISVGYNGEIKLAEDIKAGDYLLTMNMTTGQYELDQVQEVIVRTRYFVNTITLVDGTILRITSDHPILTDEGWKCCDYESSSYDIYPEVLLQEDLQVGDKVKTQNGYVEIASIEEIYYTSGITVYTFKMTNNKNFFADNILVHNPPVCPF